MSKSTSITSNIKIVMESFSDAWNEEDKLKKKALEGLGKAIKEGITKNTNEFNRRLKQNVPHTISHVPPPAFKSDRDVDHYLDLLYKEHIDSGEIEALAGSAAGIASMIKSPRPSRSS